MAHIKMDFDGLLQQSSTLGQLGQNYEGLNSRMRSLTEQISEGWEGEASRAYVEMMQKYIQQAGKMTGILQAFRGYANQATTDFQELDRTCAAAIRNSF